MICLLWSIPMELIVFQVLLTLSKMFIINKIHKLVLTNVIKFQEMVPGPVANHHEDTVLMTR